MKQLYKRALESRSHTFYFPKDEELTSEELRAFINENTKLASKYRKNMKMYLGKHDILNKNLGETGQDSRLVVNLPKYITDTFDGYFLGIPPKINLPKDSDNELLQNWLKQVSFQDKLAKAAEFTSIYGRCYGFIYQNESSETRFAVSSPTSSFMIYDDTIEHNPLAFVRYSYLKNESEFQAQGSIYYATGVYDFTNCNIDVEMHVNPYGQVPATEFMQNDTKTGVFESVKTLVNALDEAISHKADQVAYFDNAYLILIGAKLPEKEDGTPNVDLKRNRFLYIPNVDPGAKPELKFIAKPDADAIQEHLIDRLTKWIYQVSMVPNLDDESFSGNASGVALQYKLLAMKNMAATKERKFTQALRTLFDGVFATSAVLPETSKETGADLAFTFTRNMPEDLASEISAAKDATGIVSKKTQLSLLPFVSDVEQEQKQIDAEKADSIKQAQKATQYLPDYITDRGGQDEPDKPE